MKRFILILFVIFSIKGVYAQNTAYNKTIHRDYGTFKIIDNKNVVSVSAFVTIEKEIDVLKQKKIYPRKLLKKIINKSEKKHYHYEIYLVSKSIVHNDTTSTWLYGTKIYANGKNILEKEFPNGFMVLVKTEPTLIHTYHNDNLDVNFKILWNKSKYEHKVHK